MSTQNTLAAESGHYYHRLTGEPAYEVPCKSKDGMRSTTIKDARVMDLVPSVTTILGVMAKPGLEAWKAKQLLEASLTLPKLPGETVDDYAKRVIEDSKAQGLAAAERGTELHKAIELYINGNIIPVWSTHLDWLDKTLTQYGIDLRAGKPEHSFAACVNGLWYGGKVDYHHAIPTVLDFKSKDKIEPKKPMVFDEHAMQIAAYGYGLYGNLDFRGINVFVGVNDCEIRVHDHTPKDLKRGMAMFEDVLSFWSKKQRFGKYAQSE